MNKYKLYTILIITFLSSGCVATSNLMRYSETVETTSPGNIGEFLDGVITKDNIAILCFSGSGSDLSDTPFSIEIPVERYFDAIELGEDEYKRSKHSFYRRSKHTFYIPTKKISAGCPSSHNGRKIIKLNGKYTYSANEWGKLDNKYNYSPLYIPKDDNIAISRFNGSYLHLSINNEPHKQNIHFIPEITKTKEGCDICYAGVPFTVVIDIVIFPFVAIYYIFSGQAIQMGL